MADETPDATEEPTAPAAADVAAAPADAPEAAVDAEPEPDAGARGREPEPVDPELAALFARFETALGDGVVDHVESPGNLVVRVRPDAWRRAADGGAKPTSTATTSRSSSGIDWHARTEAAGRRGRRQRHVVAGAARHDDVRRRRLRRPLPGVRPRAVDQPKHWGVTIKTDVNEAAPVVDSWVPVYPGADWHERECWEMYGIGFDGSPEAPSPVPARRVRGAPAAQGLRAARPRGEAVARARRRRADARRRPPRKVVT